MVAGEECVVKRGVFVVFRLKNLQNVYMLLGIISLRENRCRRTESGELLELYL